MMMSMGQGISILVRQMNPAFRHPAFAILLLLIVTVMATVAIVLHFIALEKLERRLNLA